MASKVAAKVLPPLPTIRDIIRLYKLSAIKQLSQNFLMDLRLTDKIVKSAGRLSYSEVCEVGPGPGGITRSILNRGPSKLILIEKDIRFKPVLELLAEASTQCKTEIIYDDVIKFDMSRMFSPELSRDWYDNPPNIHLIGNLPFSVSTALIVKWLHAISERRSAWSYGRTRMTLTFQKEVAERMVAEPGASNRCRLSVMCQNWCDVYHKFTIPGKAFVPKPDVDVGVVHFVPKTHPIIDDDFQLVERFLRTLFNFRQRCGYNTASHLFPKSRQELTEKLFEVSGINGQTRPYMMTNEEFKQLLKGYKWICDSEPDLYNYNYRGPRATRESDWTTTVGGSEDLLT